jgi:hypothetical protein
VDFYILQPDGGRLFGPKWAHFRKMDPLLYGEASTCPMCGGFVGGLRWLPTHRIRLSSAKPEKWGDFLWGASFSLMVSAHFKAAYEAEGLAGITVFHPPAEVVRVGGKKTGDVPPSVPTYHVVEIVWNGGNLDDTASGIVREEKECTFCRGAAISFEQVVIEPSSWIEADIFVARGLPGEIIVTERFKHVVENYDLKNTWLIPADRYAYDVHRRGLWYVREE